MSKERVSPHTKEEQIDKMTIISDAGCPEKGG
jgi:hypothetical protein